jgi:putative ABC transport system permease protein
VGLLLASLGLYSVIALAVRQRRREIGIRLALGAAPARVAYMFLASGVRLAAIGLLFGLPFGFVLIKLFLTNAVIGADLLPTALGIGVVMLLIASAATWIPARQAARLDPAMTLRTE